jgi:hypothetical protein
MCNQMIVPCNPFIRMVIVDDAINNFEDSEFNIIFFRMVIAEEIF